MEVHVPFVDLSASHKPLKRSVLAAVEALIDTNEFIGGPPLSDFEAAWARYVGTARCVGVASGLDALRLGLLASGIGRGDDVIVPALTFTATFEAVAQAGAVPVPVDANEADWELDVGAIDGAVTPRTRAVVPVHLYGQLADVRTLAVLAELRGLTIVEDACQAHGAERDGIRAGTAGHAAAFSFYPTKNLGAMGDAGALVTDDAEVADVARALRDHGQTEKWRHDREGYTARLDTLQAAILLQKLPQLDGWIDERRRLAAAYTAALADVDGMAAQPVPAGSAPAWHLYVVRTSTRDALADHLTRRGIETGRHYPTLPHLSPAFAHLGHGRGDFPVAERIADECLSLPLYPGMSNAQHELVVTSVREFFGV